MMPNIAWRCEDDDGDVKYAERPEHVAKLEARGYTCALDPDPQYDTTTIYDHGDT